MKLSPIIGGSALLIGGIVNDVAVQEQAALEQYNIINYLGGAAPYLQHSGFGISTDLPPTCTIEQVQMIRRHGERFPTPGSGPKYNATINTMKAMNLNGSLSFFNDYEFFVTNTSNYGQLTTPENCGSIFAGSQSAQSNGKAFRERYGELYKANTTMPVFTSNSERVHDTSIYFMKGFLGEGYDETQYKLNIISEDADMGANSLTPKEGCDNYSKDKTSSDNLGSYVDAFIERVKEDGNPNFNITRDDFDNLVDSCSYELNVRGESQICGIFTSDELISRQYADDVDLYYNYGPGNSLTPTIGSVFTKASIKLLTEEADNKIWLSFTHDNDIVVYYSSIGLFNETVPLSRDHIEFGKKFSKPKIIPQSSRIYLEKYVCGDENSYVRFVVNDAVVPLTNCNDGPGYSCELNEYVDLMSGLTALDYNNACGVSGPDEISFYWDYTTVNYNATLEV